MSRVASILVLLLFLLVLFTFPSGDGKSYGARAVSAIRATVKP